VRRLTLARVPGRVVPEGARTPRSNDKHCVRETEWNECRGIVYVETSPNIKVRLSHLNCCHLDELRLVGKNIIPTLYVSLLARYIQTTEYRQHRHAPISGLPYTNFTKIHRYHIMRHPLPALANKWTRGAGGRRTTAALSRTRTH